MDRFVRLLTIVFVLLSLVSVFSAQPAPATQLRAIRSNLPLAFEPNVGQTDGQVVFLARAGGQVLFLTHTGAVVKVQRDDNKEKPASPTSASKPLPPEVFRLELAGANPKVRIAGAQPLPGISNYLIGNDPSRWHTNIRNYAQVRYEGVYPGIDLVYYGNRQQLEYDIVVKPGADASQIAWQIDGSTPRIETDGSLNLAMSGASIKFLPPRIYQLVAGVTHEVTGRYQVTGNRVAFEIGNYDKTRELTIDPVVGFSTYLGGSSNDRMNGIAVDKNGNVYVAGRTESADFPVLHNIQSYAGGRDVAVAKMNAAGSALIYSTFIGGSADEVGRGLTIDASGNAYVVGNTLSSNFPVTGGAFQTTYAGDTTNGLGDAFALKLNAAGNALVYSTYMGGSAGDELSEAVLDASGNLYSALITSSTNFPVTPGAFQITCANPFLCGGVIKLNSTGTAQVFSTFLGGSGPNTDVSYTLALDSSNNVYVVGATGSPNFPTTAGAFDQSCGTDGSCNGLFDGYIAKLNSAGSALVYSTFIGGSSGDAVTGVAVDKSGNAYLYGGTSSSDFPTTAGSAQPVFGGGSPGCDPNTFNCGDNFIAKLNAQGSHLMYSTYLGGSGDENYSQIEAMAIDSSNNVWVVGETDSVNFPLANATQGAYGGGAEDAFVTELNSTGSQFLFSTYLGGSSTDLATAVKLDASGNAYVAGATSSPNFPVTVGAFQTQCGTDGTCNGGLLDAFVTKFKLSADLSVTNTAPGNVNSGATLTYTIAVTNNGTDAASPAQMQDVTPTGTTFNSVTTTAGSCTAPPPGGTGAVTCQTTSLANGASFTVLLTVNVTAPSGSTITDKAAVKSKTFDPNTANNSKTAHTHVN